jgi:hexosaminidase
VNNDGNHGNQEKEGRAALKKGYHRLKVVYFDSGGDNNLKILMQPVGGKKEELPSSILYH